VLLHTVHAAHAFACGVVVAVGTRAKARQGTNGASVCFRFRRHFRIGGLSGLVKHTVNFYQRRILDSFYTTISRY